MSVLLNLGGEPTVPIIPPGSFEVTRGQFVSGTLADLAESDNADLVARRNISDVQARVFLEVTGTSLIQHPTEMTFTLEASVFARSTVMQSIDLYNFATGAFEEVDSRPANQFSDLVTLAPAAGDLTRFVMRGTGLVRARIRFVSVTAREQFSANIDQTIWRIE